MTEQKQEFEEKLEELKRKKGREAERTDLDRVKSLQREVLTPQSREKGAGLGYGIIWCWKRSIVTKIIQGRERQFGLAIRN